VSSTITIEGHGGTITRDGTAPAFRIFAVNSTGNLTLNETTVSGGLATGSFSAGGGVLNAGGALTLTNSTVSGNSTEGQGGGISSNTDRSGHTTTLTNSTVSGNSAGGAGGGLFNGNGLTVIDHSTITQNTAPSGQDGGVESVGDVATLTRVRASIIAANTATDVDLFFGPGTNSFDSDGGQPDWGWRCHGQIQSAW
jgi:predicted outer membrane repeat protein